MHRPVFALWERTLRIETRGLAHCLVRAAVPAILLFVLWGVEQTTRFQITTAPGQHFFSSIIWVNFWLISLGGLSHFAAVITEEKEEQMLGLLRMTALSPVAILLGKSTSRLLGAGLLLVAQFPFTLLAFTLGGVSRLQIAAAYLALAAYLVLLSNLALLWSVVCRRTMAAATLTGLCLAGFFLLPKTALEVATDFARNSGRLEWLDSGWYQLLGGLAAASPIAALNQIRATGFGGSLLGVQVWTNLAGGLLCFGLAWLGFDRFCRQDTTEAPARLVLFRRALRRHRVPARIGGARAITWKDFQFVAGGWRGGVLKFLMLGLLIGGICALFFMEAGIRPQDRQQYAGATMMITALLTGGFVLAFDASRLFRLEARWQTLSSLLMLPYSVREIAYRKILGMLWGLVPFVAWLLIGFGVAPELVLKDLFRDLMRVDFDEALGFVLAVVQGFLFLHLVVFLSLLLKRGALPLAMVIHYFSGVLALAGFAVLGFFNRGSIVAGLFLLTLLSLGLTIWLHVAIGRRLVQRACQE